MKILTVTLIVIILFSLGFLGLFYYSLRITQGLATTLLPTSSANPGATGPTPTPSSFTAPTGFHGPTTKPTMRGPSGPPPNY